MVKPKLRFKEFNEEYKKYKIGNTLKVKSGKDKKLIECMDGRYPILGTGGKIGTTNNFLYDNPSVLIGRKGTINKPQYMTTPFWTVDTLFYTDIKKGFNTKYIFYAFQNINWKKYDESTGVPSLSSKTIEEISYYIPNKNEQDKVSAFFTLLDKKIELQKRKIDALKIYKRGLIKKVFAKLDGKQIPLKLILKETFNYAQKGHEYPHVTLSKDGIYEKTDRYNRDFLVKDSSKQYKITHKYDLCYNPANLKFGVICLNLYGSAIFSPIYVTFEINKNYNPEFVAYYLCRSEFINYIRRYEQGTVYERMAVNSTDFLKYNLTIPSYEKQEKIVKLLNSLENKINNNLKIYHDFEKIKKGLLQQMFI